MELIVAMFILAGWYAYKHFKAKKAAVPTVVVVEEVEEASPPPKRKVVPTAGVVSTAAEVSCDFCQGEEIFIAGTKEKMPCPKCRRGMKIS